MNNKIKMFQISLGIFLLILSLLYSYWVYKNIFIEAQTSNLELVIDKSVEYCKKVNCTENNQPLGYNDFRGLYVVNNSIILASIFGVSFYLFLTLVFIIIILIIILIFDGIKNK